MNKLRNWILAWLLGDDLERMNNMFELAVKFRGVAERTVEANNQLLDDYKRLSKNYFKIIDAAVQTEDMEEFRRMVLTILKESVSV